MITALILFAAMMQGLPNCRIVMDGKVVGDCPKPLFDVTSTSVSSSREPMDVPAIWGISIRGEWYEGECRSLHGEFIRLPDRRHGWDYGSCRYENWHCSDKSRVLLTAEDGNKHCVKFQ